MKILGYAEAIIVGYIVGYFITVAAMTLISLFTNRPLSRSNEEDIFELSLAWPALPLLFLLMIFGALVILVMNSGKEIVRRIKERFKKITERGSK